MMSAARIPALWATLAAMCAGLIHWFYAWVLWPSDGASATTNPELMEHISGGLLWSGITFASLTVYLYLSRK